MIHQASGIRSMIDIHAVNVRNLRHCIASLQTTRLIAFPNHQQAAEARPRALTLHFHYYYCAALAFQVGPPAYWLPRRQPRPRRKGFVSTGSGVELPSSFLGSRIPSPGPLQSLASKVFSQREHFCLLSFSNFIFLISAIISAVNSLILHAPVQTLCLCQPNNNTCPTSHLILP